MAIKKRRYSTLYCKYCNGNQEMQSMGEGLSGKITWFKCLNCGKISYFKAERLQTLLNSHPLLENAKARCVEYDPTKTFMVGQYLYHKVWNDKGEVLKKEITSSGKQTIIVSFDKLGERRLIENLRV